ncbi:uncharacterized protein LOC114933374 [Nylanderia fulva]|uniref:uncharacterized protein LOC114933374 n=1 Tax=Nylanderia fulva TaxID=613905 RepID=UPI0010FB3F17|nr:uncharacterized protein LOC114933374 [Nylanderia fulva]
MSAQELRRQRGYVKAKVTKTWKYVENVVNKRIAANIETITVHLELEQAYNDFNELVTTKAKLKATLSKWKAALKPAVSASGSNESLAHVLEQQTEVIRALSASAHNENKHQYLVGAVTGSAAKIIESIEISVQNYEIAWNLLKNRYEDPKALKRRHIHCLFEAPKVGRESAVEIEELVNHFQKHLRILKSMESESESWAESLMLFMIEEKLGGSTRRRCEESMEGRGEVSVNLLFEFLQRRVRMLNRLGNSISEERSIPKRPGPKSGRVNAIESSRSLRKGESRASGSNQRNTPERIEEVKRLRLCFNCLKNDHFVNACKASSCRRCSGRHNTLCHTDHEKGHAQKVIASNRKTVDGNSEKSNSVNLSVHHVVKRANFGQVLMATAVIYIRDSRGFEQPIRVLLDSASEANFITKAVCARLNIKTDDIHEAVSGINNTICAITRGCRVTIRLRVTSYQVSAFCLQLVVPKITRELPAAAISAKSFSVTDTVKLADPQYFQLSQIDMLLGSEFFIKLLEPAKIELGTNYLHCKTRNSDGSFRTNSRSICQKEKRQLCCVHGYTDIFAKIIREILGNRRLFGTREHSNVEQGMCVRGNVCGNTYSK